MKSIHDSAVSMASDNRMAEMTLSLPTAHE